MIAEVYITCLTGRTPSWQTVNSNRVAGDSVRRAVRIVADACLCVTSNQSEDRMRARRENCVQCARPVADHFTADREWIGCVPLTPVNVTVNGETTRLESKRDAYRFCARLKKAA
jgi:hypothetical protein